MIIELFTSQFMIKALWGGLLTAVICSALGVFIILRRQSFLVDGIAHASLSGIAVGIVLFSFPTLWAILVAVVMAVLITYLKQQKKITFDASIGIVYSFLFAVGIFILNTSNQYTPELNSYLFGSILSINLNEIFLQTILLITVFLFLKSNYKKVVYMTFDEEAAKVRGIDTRKYEYIINILSAVAIVVSINLMGVVLVTALMVIPASFAKMYSKKFSSVLPLSLGFGILSTISGLIISYFLNSPTGATIVILQSVSFFILSIFIK